MTEVHRLPIYGHVTVETHVKADNAHTPPFDVDGPALPVLCYRIQHADDYIAVDPAWLLDPALVLHSCDGEVYTYRHLGDAGLSTGEQLYRRERP